MIAVLIVIVLFVKVLEQFGLIEAGLEGKGVLFSALPFVLIRLLSRSQDTCERGARRDPSRLRSGLRPAGCLLVLPKLRGLLSREKHACPGHGTRKLGVTQREMPSNLALLLPCQICAFKVAGVRAGFRTLTCKHSCSALELSCNLFKIGFQSMHVNIFSTGLLVVPRYIFLSSLRTC